MKRIGTFINRQWAMEANHRGDADEGGDDLHDHNGGDRRVHGGRGDKVVLVSNNRFRTKDGLPHREIRTVSAIRGGKQPRIELADSAQTFDAEGKTTGGSGSLSLSDHFGRRRTGVRPLSPRLIWAAASWASCFSSRSTISPRLHR